MGHGKDNEKVEDSVEVKLKTQNKLKILASLRRPCPFCHYINIFTHSAASSTFKMEETRFPQISANFYQTIWHMKTFFIVRARTLNLSM